jgi:hypothetical protein
VKRLVCGILGAAFLASSAVAGGVRPVTQQLKERESGRFLVQWLVPKQLPSRAIPSPVLPDSCRVVGERTVVERPGTWNLRQLYRCPDGLSGQELRIDYPFLNVTVSTLLRVELLSGERYAHMLAPGEHSWRVPEAASGGVPAWLRAAREAVLGGADHFAGNAVHGLFLLSLLLLGGFGIAIRLATAFTAGQLAAVAVVSFSGIRLGAPPAEVGVAVAAALLAREALRPSAERRQLAALAAAAGLVHGLGIADWAAPAAQDGGASAAFLFVVVLGMDAALLLSAMALWGLGQLVPRQLSEAPARSVAAYGVAGVALALALSAPVAKTGAAAGEKSGGLRLQGLSIPEGGAGPAGSRRVAARFPDAALQSFVAVAAFEVRHEVLVRLSDVADRIGLGPSGELAVGEQDDVKRRVRDLVAVRTSVAIDKKRAEPVDFRIDFLGLDPQGALPRLSPIPEPVDVAWLGVTAVYPTAATPREVAVRWESFDAAETIPATVTDPESSRSVELTADRPVLRWENELSEDFAPIVTAIDVEPATVWLPVWSLLPLGALLFFGLAVVRDRRRELSLALVRVMIAGAFVLGPVAGVAMALPFSVGSVPDPVRAKRILAGVLPNVYRAFEFPTESAVYDRLALSVTGETLTEVYLEHRRAVRMEERGGAKARVEAVEVLEVDSVEPDGSGGFAADAAWTVGGTVTHFGHRHFRQNRYDARVVVVPVESHWKIRTIEVHDEQRLR